MPRTMYDSIRATGMPDDGDLYCAYTDGLYANVGAVMAAHPGKPLIRISALGRTDADVIDIEPGCVWPPSAARSWLAARPGATIYCGLAKLPEVVDALGTDHPYWVAHYTNRAHVCTNSCIPRGSVPAGVRIVGVQYGGDISTPGLHYDVSAVYDDSWFSSSHQAEGDATPIDSDADLSGGLHKEEDEMANYLPLYVVGMEGHARANDVGGAYYLVNDNEATYTWISPAQLDRFRGMGLQEYGNQGADIVGGYRYIGPGDYEVVVVQSQES